MHKGNQLASIRRKSTLGTSIAIALGVTLPGLSANSAFGQEELEEIVVTGSRIVRRDYQASSPIVTVNEETFDQISSVGVENALNQLPQFVPDQTQYSSGDVQPSAFNTPGIATLNLRGLGANRNLVLVDGRRAQPANAQLVVDINSIPAAAIESVEVISGGASAVYGADAMGGVTNFILKKNFEGFNLNLQTSGTEHGGGEETTVSALIGGSFGTSGNVMVGLSASERQAVKQADRDFYVDGWRDPNTTGGQDLPFSNIEFGNNPPTDAAYAGIFGPGMASAGEEVYVNRDGSLFLNSPDAGALGYTGPLNTELKLLGEGTENPGTLSASNLDALVTTPLKRYSFFARANYDLTDNMNVFLQGNYNQMQVDTVLNWAPATSQWAATIPVDGREIPPQLQTLLDSRADPDAPYTLSRPLDFAGPRRTRNTTDMFQILAGVDGDIGDTTWTYEAYISHGRTSLLTEMNGFPGLQNYRSVVSAPDFGENLVDSVGPPLFFELTCTSGLPIFENFTPSQDCVDAISGNMKQLTDMEQDIMELNVQGEIMELPAGVLAGAFGASTRENTFRWRPDAQLVRPSTNYPVGLFPTSYTQGEISVDELYGELLVPVIGGIDGIVEQLNLEIGARYSDYSTAGEIWTYKGLIDWTVNDFVRIRGGYQKANRAPNVAELYTGPTTSVVGFAGADPCMANTQNTTWGNHPDNPDRQQVIELCSQLINNSGANNDSTWHTSPDYPNAIVGPFPFNFAFELANITGNPDLENEEADTYTLGLVLNSPFTGILENATLSVDYYQVEISDAIAPTDAYSVYSKCLNENGNNPNYEFNEFCELITRDPANGYRATVDTPYFNLGGIETSGVDVQLNWGMDIAGGLLSVSSVLNYLNEYKDQQTVEDPFIESTGTLRSGGQFDYRTFTTVNFIKNNWSVGFNHRFLPAIESLDYATDPDTNVEGPGSYHMVNAFGSYTVNDQITLRGGVDNLFDTEPEVVGRNPGVNNANGTTNGAYYDPLGRRYYVAVEMNF